MRGKKQIAIILGIIALLGISSNHVFAAGQMYFDKTDFVGLTVGDSVSVKIEVDTGGAEVVKIKAVLKYDPTMLHLDTNNVTTYSNQCTWPSDQNYFDDQNGVISLTADCSTNPYKSSGTADDGAGDYWVGLKFDTLKSGNSSVDWVYTGTDDGNSTVLMENQSPPQNILLSAPSPLNISVVGGNSSNGGKGSTSPSTGIFDNEVYAIAGGLGVIGIILGWIVYHIRIVKTAESTIVLISDNSSDI